MGNSKYQVFSWTRFCALIRRNQRHLHILVGRGEIATRDISVCLQLRNRLSAGFLKAP